MPEEKITTKTSEVHVEQHGGEDAKATVKKDGKSGAASGSTAQEAIDKADQSKK